MPKNYGQENHCEKKNCCRYDSWEDCDEECGQIHEKVREIVIKQHIFEQKACQTKKWGYTTKCEGEYHHVEKCNEAPRLVKQFGHKECNKKGCNDKRHNH